MYIDQHVLSFPHIWAEDKNITQKRVKWQIIKNDIAHVNWSENIDIEEIK